MARESDSDLAPPTRGDCGVPTNRRIPRLLAFSAVAVWFLVLLVGVGYGAVVVSLGDAYCEPFEGGSDFGDLRWSAVPPGPTCTFTAEVHGFDEVRGPYPVMSIWLVALAAGGALCVALLRASRSKRSRASQPTRPEHIAR